MHSYTLFFFADAEIDRRMKRYVRDHLHYNDHLWCLAQRVVRAVRRDAQQNAITMKEYYVQQQQEEQQLQSSSSSSSSSSFSPSSSLSSLADVRSVWSSVASFSPLQPSASATAAMEPYASMHIRHGDFQFKVVRHEADDVLASVSKDVLTAPGQFIYVATDEVRLLRCIHTFVFGDFSS